MDKETLSNYGWIVILTLILAVLLALASPFGNFIADGFKATYAGFAMVGNTALGIVIPGSTPEGGVPDNGGNEPQKTKHTFQDMIEIGDYLYTWTACEDYEEYVQGEMKYQLRTVGLAADTYEERFLMYVEYKYGCTWEELQAQGYTKETVYSAVARNEEQANMVLDTYIGRGGYWDVTALDKTKETYGEILTELDGYPITHMLSTFKGCTNMTTAPEIPSTVIYMRNAFEGCTNLETYVGSTAPNGDLSNYRIPDGLIDLDSGFKNCDSMEYAPKISHCTKLKDMSMAFSYCDVLKAATTPPANVQDMGQAFEYCPQMITICNISHCTKITNMAALFANSENICTYEGSTASDGDFSGYVLPNNIDHLTSVFAGCKKMVVAPAIPASVTTLRFAFTKTGLIATPEMSHLTNLTYMLGAFEECKQLKTTSAIPENVTNISQAFYGCTSLTGTVEIRATNLEEYNLTFRNVNIKGQGITFTGVESSCNKVKTTGYNY